MKKNVSLLAVSMMISLAMVSGCSASGGSVREAEAAVESTATVEPETGEPAGEDTADETTESSSSDGSASEASTENEIKEMEPKIEESGSETELEESASKEDSDTEDSREEKMAPARIWGVVTETGTNSIIVDNQSDISSPGEIVLMIDPNSTYVLDGANGFPVSLDEVQTGSFYAYLGPTMTMSLPPQSVPYAVIVNIPEDAAAPLYVIAADAVNEKENTQILTANDGTEYPLAEDARVQPFLTKNIVQMTDIQSGSECLLWLNAESVVERIVLLSK
ncbi:MAG: hypothetical protein LIO92_04885 [Clostridiales bacterium]|nr:hypothetical protein [Clostridiales bacterium]